MPPKKKANGSDPTDKDGWFERGEELEATGRKDEAVAAFLRAMEMDPSWSYPRFRAAQILSYDLGLNEEALELLDGTPAGVVDSDLTFIRGRALANLGRMDEAVEQYKKALVEEADNPASANNRSDIFCALALDVRSRVPEGLGYAESACAANPVNAHAWEVVGYFQFLSGDRDLAARSLCVAVAIEGPTMVETLRSDPDFAGFHDDPRFLSSLKTRKLDDATVDDLSGSWPSGDLKLALLGFLDRFGRRR